MPAFSYYKGPRIPKGRHPCLLCPAPSVDTTLVHLGHGDAVWLCAAHAAPAFRRSRAGRDFLLTIFECSTSAGAWTPRRSRAVARFLATDAEADARAAVRSRPGSYTWPDLRRAVEELCRRGRFATAVLLRCVEAALRADKSGWSRPPSLRTIRRWRAERRWEAPGWTAPESLPRGV